MLPGLLEVQVRLAHEYALFPVLPRSITWAPDPGAYQRVLAELDAAGLPVVDHCRGTLAIDPAILETRWRELLDALPPGVTHLALHATAPGDFAAAAPNHAMWRTAEYEFLRRGGLAKHSAHLGVSIQTTGSFQRRWRRSQRSSSTIGN